MGMRLDDRAVDEVHDGSAGDATLLRSHTERLPPFGTGPAPKTLVHAVPVAEHRRQVAPRCARSEDPPHRFEEQPHVAARSARSQADERRRELRPHRGGEMETFPHIPRLTMY